MVSATALSSGGGGGDTGDRGDGGEDDLAAGDATAIGGGAHCGIAAAAGIAYGTIGTICRRGERLQRRSSLCLSRTPTPRIAASVFLPIASPT